jgi:multidrug transporter EmrE-like cation transporter
VTQTGHYLSFCWDVLVTAVYVVVPVVWCGVRLSPAGWAGLALALAGLVVLKLSAGGEP